jgi:hypothetical protein
MNTASIFLQRIVAIGFVVATFSLAAPYAWAVDEKSIAGFTEAIKKLSPDVDPREAEAVSETSHRMARQLARDYRVVGPAVFQNFLINIGARQRGYCAHYARDIGTRLKELRLKTLYLHWGAADAGTHLEHNVIVVTGLNQDFHQGYIIDGWRNAGRLCWWPVLKDSGYVWKEDLQETAWLHDYELVQQKPSPQLRVTVQPKPASLQQKAPVQSKAQADSKPQVQPKTPIQQKTQATTASVEIKG